MRAATRATLALLLALALLACQPAPHKERLRQEFFAMGGIPVHVTGWDVQEERFNQVVEELRREVLRLESRMSVYQAGSLLSRLNEAKGEPVLLDPETADLVARALAYAEETGSAFDPTVRPFVALWQQAAKDGRLPDAGDLARVRAQVGRERISLGAPDPKGQRTIQLTPGTALDVGGVAKGYFADLGLARLRAAGVKRALVELGGDLAAYDERPTPAPFRVGVRHPFDAGGLLGVVELAGGAVVTSGDYERRFVIGERRYNHIIDPRTGRPTEGVHSATVLSPDGARADALATALVVMGEKTALAFVEARPELEAILVVADPAAPEGWRTVVSSGLKERFQPEP